MSEDRQRADRKTEERTERRRRNDSTIDGSRRLKLAIPDDVAKRLEAEGKEPRWVNDDNIHERTVNDDYDRVDGVEARVVGRTKEGVPIKAHLHAKRKDFIADDRAKAEAARRETETALTRGKNPTDPIAGDDSFYADAANSIGRGRRAP